MPALNFPTTGLYEGYQYTGDNGVTYIYDGIKWVGHAPTLSPGTSALVNNGYVVQLDGSGNVILPPGSTGKIQWPYGNSTIESGMGFHIRSEEGISIETVNTVGVPASHSWVFGTDGNLVPGSDNTQDIGSPTARVRHIYVGPGSITVGNAVISESATGKLVLPGLTRATALHADEVQDTEDQSYSFSSTPSVVDEYEYTIRAGATPDGSYVAAEYSVDGIDGEGFIDGITVDVAGTWTQAIADVNRRNAMHAYIGADINGVFNASDWITIEFVVRAKADDVEYEFSTGGGGSELVNGDYAFTLNNNGTITLPKNVTFTAPNHDVTWQGWDFINIVGTTGYYSDYPANSTYGGEGTSISLQAGQGGESNDSIHGGKGGILDFHAGNGQHGGPGGAVTIGAGAATWSGNVNVRGGDINLTAGDATNPNQVSAGHGTGGDLHLFGGRGNSQGGSVFVHTSDDHSGLNFTKQWEFDQYGSITFPDNTIQTTAYPGASGYVTTTSGITFVNNDAILSTPGTGTIYTSSLRTGIPSFLVVDETVTDPQHGFDGNGMWFSGNANLNGYPVRTDVTFSETEQAVVEFDFLYDQGCADQGVCVFLDGDVPDWSWGSNPTCISAKYNCGTPQLDGFNSSQGSNIDLIVGNTYRARFTYNPNITDSVKLETFGTDLTTVIDTLVLQDKLSAGAYRVGFSGDQDSSNGPFKAYFTNLSITPGTYIAVQEWKFGSTGDLTLPTDGNILNRAGDVLLSSKISTPVNINLDGGGASTIYEETSLLFADGGFASTRRSITDPLFDAGANGASKVYGTNDNLINGGGA